MRRLAMKHSRYWVDYQVLTYLQVNQLRTLANDFPLLSEIWVKDGKMLEKKWTIHNWLKKKKPIFTACYLLLTYGMKHVRI